ncbi:MAG: universal stress protein [Ancrocorticia sp.]|jgi:Universal stress protein family.|nr:universal stress protein [Ancrocorticia sp.]MCI1895526.1 universal stress protein [Ancrocorticia sp.]MCI1932199.1 universal stress protein [Ancrocorticia sp.]MCI1963559.1 universal stress protein [Ancrocorticia sp.]MCI2002690.1 universal stress protein [Ancrocorticia sp.]
MPDRHFAADRVPPQPSIDRIPQVTGHPLVVAVEPRQPDLVAHTAVQWAQALGNVPLAFAYVDPTRVVEAEAADGTVRHAPLDPDSVDDSWRELQESMTEHISQIVNGTSTQWRFYYLAGRPDRALTHLARALDAPAIIVGSRRPSPFDRGRDFFSKSVALELTRHQHRPVLIVPTGVVDWKTGVQW